MAVLGEFSSHIVEDIRSISKWSTHSVYLSAIYTSVVEKFPVLKATCEDRYSKLRDNVNKKYIEISGKNGTPMEDNAVLGEIYDFQYNCKIHWEKEGADLMMRSLKAIDWQAGGRVSEVCSLNIVMLLCIYVVHKSHLFFRLLQSL
jgi:hypothetical protein